MDEAGYQRYLKESGKRELARVAGNITDARAAQAALTAIMSEKWLWGVLPHNCIAMVEKVIKAGGGDFSTATNCPVMTKVQQDLEQGMGRLDWEIRRLYGGP
jgi:hypothetical protein